MCFSSFLAYLAKIGTKGLSLNAEPCMVRFTLIDLNPIELNYYPFIISSDKCKGICNVLSPKIYYKENKRHKIWSIWYDSK